MTVEWNAARYHELSEPQFQWGVAVLARLDLRGDERVIDAGCGSGRLTERLLDRLPHGRVVAVDRSRNMLLKAREHLQPRFGPRVSFLQTDLADLALAPHADVIFSTATFHWVLDQDRLFRSLYQALRPGGRLHAQCGGGPNLTRIQTRAGELMADPIFAPHFAGWQATTYYAAPEATADRMARAGFEEVEAWLETAPATFDSAHRFREFISIVVLRTHLDRLPADLRDAYADRVTALAAHDDPPFTLDYCRLNIRGRRPFPVPVRSSCGER